MLKILYAVSNNVNSALQLIRFLNATKEQPYIIKIAAYKTSSPKGISIDWTLDCLFNMFNPNKITEDRNDNFIIYYEQVKKFDPDLIISDLESYTSYIGQSLNKEVWQCGSLIINYALTQKEKYSLGIHKKYGNLFYEQEQYQRNAYVIDNSNKKFIYSHFGEINNNPIEIKSGFEWIKPYHTIGKKSIPCQHNIVAILPNNRKNIIKEIKESSQDNIIFTPNTIEKYDNIIVKDFSNLDEYFCNLSNSKLLVCEGQSVFLADAFYNKKPVMIYMDYLNTESVLNTILSKRLNLSVDNLSQSIDIDYQPNPNIKFLHEKINEYYNL